jgi:Pyruvate:ferredoxin oxidoreductase and related 2-oxoacid:ferredoxin oxidoreductases, beta subunit
MQETVVYQRPKSWVDGVSSHYCPGCTHGIIHRLLCEIIDELDLQDKMVGVAPVGCAALMYGYIDIDFVEAPHGRAPAVATGIKRVRPELCVLAYQGDGDLASIGCAEIVHAANRSENISVIFVNNAIYGMTGGQMAPTTLLGQKTTTSPLGRDAQTTGYPMKVSEMLSALGSEGYIERVTVGQPKYIPAAKKSDPQSNSKPTGWQGLLYGRSSFHLPHELGDARAGGRQLAGGKHDPLLSAGQV